MGKPSSRSTLSIVAESSCLISASPSRNNLANLGSFRRFLRFELYLFFTALSVRPSTPLAISHHLFPCFRWSLTIAMSSSIVHLRLTTFGSRWLCHLSRHCLPMRLGRFLAICVQFRAPHFLTARVNISSSCFVQLPNVKWLQAINSSQRVWHLISDFPGRSLLMRFQEF